MKLLVNGVAVDLAEATTVVGLLKTLGRNARGVAVAVNGEVVPRSTWSYVELRVGDHVEVLVVAQGG